MSYYQGRMMYPSYVGGRPHPKRGQPHPFLYAGAQYQRAYPHKYFRTQPTGYGIRSGDPRYSGTAGSNPWFHARAGIYRPPVAQASWVNVKTRRGRQASYKMSGLARNYRSERAAKRREFKRGQRDLRRQMRVMEKNDPWAAGDKRYLKLQAQLKSQAANYRSGFKQRRDAYRGQRRSIATQRPMYASVRRHPWFGMTGWRPRRQRRRWYA